MVTGQMAMVVYKFVNPNENEATEREAVQNGIQPLMINVRDKDQIKQQKAYLGAVVSMGRCKGKYPFHSARISDGICFLNSY